MPDTRDLLVEALGGGLCGLGAGLLTDPHGVLSKAGIALEDDPATLFARLLGLRDLVLGVLLLGAPRPAARRRVLRALALMSAAEAALFALVPGSLSARSRALAVTSTLAAGAAALVASPAASVTDADELPTGGVPALVAGYLLSVAPSLRLAVVVRERETTPFAGYLLGALLIAFGWRRRGNTRGFLVNTSAAVGGALWWLIARLRERGAEAG